MSLKKEASYHTPDGFLGEIHKEGVQASAGINLRHRLKLKALR
jgi:hypothetical protein